MGEEGEKGEVVEEEMLSGPPITKGWKLYCEGPTARGLWRWTERQSALQRKAKEEFVKGRQLLPSRPQALFAPLFVDVSELSIPWSCCIAS